MYYPGGSHVPSPARPERQRHRRGRGLLQQAVRRRAGQAPSRLLENPGQGGSLNHLGIEVPDIDTVDAEQTRLAEAGLASTDERDTTCCYARQDKFWVEGTPNGESWEIYTVLADSPTYYGDDAAAAAARWGSPAAVCCGGTEQSGDPASTATPCC
jgi:hypothetical protein